MNKKSIRINLLLNNLRNIISYIFPLITFPYITRILGPEKLGTVEYASTIVSYFALFAFLGVPTYGTRLISATRDDNKRLSMAVAELSLLLLISTIIVLFVYVLFFFVFSNMFVPRVLFIILGFNILLSVFNYEWVYIGIEDQSFITKRFLIIKIVSVICLFCFIKQSSDYILYVFINVIVGGLGTIFNILNLRHYLCVVNLKELKPFKHLVPVLVTFGATVAVSVYTYVDIIMIGSICGDLYVGYYSAANKFVTIAVTLVVTLGSVLLPRLSNLLENGKEDAYKEKLYKSMNYTLLIAIPLSLGMIILGPDLLQLMAGTKYKDSEGTLQILAIVIGVIPFSHYVGFQILYANKKERVYTTAVIIGAIANLCSNIFLIPRFQHNGAAIGTVIAEVVGFITMSVMGNKYIRKYTTFSWKLLFYLISSAVMVFVIVFFKKCFNLNVIINIFVGVITYFLCILFFIKISKTSLKAFLKNIHF